MVNVYFLSGLENPSSSELGHNSEKPESSLGYQTSQSEAAFTSQDQADDFEVQQCCVVVWKRVGVNNGTDKWRRSRRPSETTVFVVARGGGAG